MSRSSLWGIDSNFFGEMLTEFENSWLFTPVADDILFQKYLPSKVFSKFGNKQSYFTAIMFDRTILRDLNKKINNCNVTEDQILWELTNQQIFQTKDKEFVADSIEKFLSINKKFTDDLEEHIFERFTEVANEIRKLENKNKYFVFKNTNCDNSVECWFEKYNEEKEKTESISLLDLDRIVTELTIIENGKIVDNILNTELKEFLEKGSL